MRATRKRPPSAPRDLLLTYLREAQQGRELTPADIDRLLRQDQAGRDSGQRITS